MVRFPAAYVIPTEAHDEQVGVTTAVAPGLNTTEVIPFSEVDTAPGNKTKETGSNGQRRCSVGLGKPSALCTLSWTDVSYTVTKGSRGSSDTGKAILKHVTGRCASGELTAVMGPSGCGKTTLLDILADRISSGTITGSIELNGQRRKPDQFRSVARYVAQEDSLLGCFTVRETLLMAAQLTLPPTAASSSVIASRVDNVIAEMGLTVCEHAYVGDIFRKGISGGQKRRLSIAIELLSNPSVLLLDEPTSGLDSAATYNLLKLLVRLCHQGRTILCTIHQPSSLVYDTFTNIMVLVQGETVFFGPRVAMIPHFAALGHPCPPYANPSEFFIGLVNADFDGHGDIPTLIQGYTSCTLASTVASQITADRTTATPLTVAGAKVQRVGPWRQFLVLLRRLTVKNVRNPGIYAVRLAMYIVLALCVGTMYLKGNARLSDNDIVVLLFGVHSFFVFNSVAVVPFFIDERAVFIRERGNSGLHVSSFVLANFLAGLPGILTLALCASVIVVALSGLKAFGWYLLNMFLSMMAAESLMHVLGAVASDGIVGIAIGSSLLGMFMLCEGFIMPAHAIPGYWLWVHYSGFHSYAFEAFVHHQFLADPTVAVPPAVLRLGISDVDATANMLILLAFAIGFELLFALILFKEHTGRR